MATTAAATTAQIWARYDAWNASVEAEFFDGSWAGRPVYIDMEDDVVERVARRAGADLPAQEAFDRMIRPTLWLWPETGGCLLDLHVRRLRRWRQGRSAADAPPCLAVLAFFVLAAEGMRT